MKHLSIAALGLLAASAALASGTTQLANPAAVFCVETGGTFVIIKATNGERGECELPDGTRVDAWDHFRENWDKTSG